MVDETHAIEFAKTVMDLALRDHPNVAIVRARLANIIAMNEGNQLTKPSLKTSLEYILSLLKPTP